jgi:DNA-binding response OmpR family regulator
MNLSHTEKKSPGRFADAPRILVVEDDEAASFLVMTHLTRAGFEVIQSWSAETAFQEVEEKLPDLVLLDLNLPGMDGYEFCKRLRLLPGGEDLPVIILSAQRSRESVLRALQAGATDFLIKPLDGPLLLHKIEANLRKKEEDPVEVREAPADEGDPDRDRDDREFVRIREEGEGTLHVPLELIDLSEAGAGLLSTIPVKPESLLTFHCEKLESITGHRDLLVRVRYSKELRGNRFRLGVEFVGLGEGERKRIRSYIFKRQSGKVKLS